MVETRRRGETWIYEPLFLLFSLTIEITLFVHANLVSLVSTQASLKIDSALLGFVSSLPVPHCLPSLNFYVQLTCLTYVALSVY